MHKRFDRLLWVSKKDFTSCLAKCLINQSPYNIPDNLEVILKKFHDLIPYTFDSIGMAEVSLATMNNSLNEVMEKIPELMAPNERKNGRDDDFICIGAVARNITCEFADKADTECWLDSNRYVKHTPTANDNIGLQLYRGIK